MVTRRRTAPSAIGAVNATRSSMRRATRGDRPPPARSTTSAAVLSPATIRPAASCIAAAELDDRLDGERGAGSFCSSR